jgi:hypothetical protein
VMDSSTHFNSITENVTGITLGDVVRPALMFDTDAQGIIDDPYFRCAANQLCQSVGNQTSQTYLLTFFADGAEPSRRSLLYYSERSHKGGYGVMKKTTCGWEAECHVLHPLSGQGKSS